MVRLLDKLRRRATSRLAHALGVAALGSALVVTVATATGLLAPLDRALSDAWFNTFHATASGKVVIVDITRAAAEQGDGLRLPRARLAALLARIAEANASRVLIDLSLTGPTTPADDAALEQALAGMHAVALTASAVATSDHAGATHWRRTGVLDRLARRARVVASDLALDRDSTLRRFSVEGAPLPALPSAAGWLAGTGDWAGASNRIDFGIDIRAVPVIDALDLLSGHADPGVLHPGVLSGRGVLVASYAAALGHDIRVPRFGVLPRPDITALAAETLLRARPLHSLGRGWSAGLAVLLDLAAVLWFTRMTAWLGALTVASLALCAFGAAAVAQSGTGLMIPSAELACAALCGYAAAQAARHPALQRLRDAVAGVFGKGDLRLARVLDETGDALVTFTPDGSVLSMNGAARDLFMHAFGPEGASIGDLLGAQADALLSATHLSRPGHLEATIERETDDHRHLDLKVNTMQAENGNWIGVASIRDVTAQRLQLDALRRMAREDPLTGLVNRLGFEQVLEEGCVGADAAEREEMMVLICDLDGFKAVNDRLGHLAGDRLLRVIADRLKSAVQVGTVARLGGDEFGVVVRAPRVTPAAAAALANRIAASVSDPIAIDGQEVRVGISVGVALYPEAGTTPDALVRVADAAMYVVKRASTEGAAGDRDAA